MLETTSNETNDDRPRETETREASAGETHVTGVIEKPADPPSDLINAGAYVFPARAREWLDVPDSEHGEAELTDVLERLTDETAVRAVPFEQ